MERYEDLFHFMSYSKLVDFFEKVTGTSIDSVVIDPKNDPHYTLVRTMVDRLEENHNDIYDIPELDELILSYFDLKVECIDRGLNNENGVRFQTVKGLGDRYPEWARFNTGHKWTVTLSINGKEYETPYSMGAAHKERWEKVGKDENGRTKYDWVDYSPMFTMYGSIDRNQALKMMYGKNWNLSYGMIQQRKPLVRPKVPKPLDILEALLCDATCVLYADTLDEFAKEFYYDGETEISKIIESFNACMKAKSFLERALS